MTLLFKIVMLQIRCFANECAGDYTHSSTYFSP
jgi:hypothetical protein